MLDRQIQFCGSNSSASRRRGWGTRLASFSETQAGVKSRGVRDAACRNFLPGYVGRTTKPLSSSGATPWAAGLRAPEWEPWLQALSGAPPAVELRSCDSTGDERRNFLLSLSETARISLASAAPLARLLAASLRSFVAERPYFRRRWVVERAECCRSYRHWVAER